jgi:hypothetical protein
MASRNARVMLERKAKTLTLNRLKNLAGNHIL